MQSPLDLGPRNDLNYIRSTLPGGYPDNGPLRTPIDQLVKSLISNKTKDAVSLAAFEELVSAFDGDWHAAAKAPAARLRYLIRAVTHPDDKAKHLKETLEFLATETADFDLSFLADMTIDEAHTWLIKRKGVGPKVAASVLNFSNLDRPSFVADTHVLRVFRRYGLIDKDDAAVACNLVLENMTEWTSADLRGFHCQVKIFGQNICKAEAAICGKCLLASRCSTHARLS